MVAAALFPLCCIVRDWQMVLVWCEMWWSWVAKDIVIISLVTQPLSFFFSPLPCPNLRVTLPPYIRLFTASFLSFLTCPSCTFHPYHTDNTSVVVVNGMFNPACLLCPFATLFFSLFLCLCRFAIMQSETSFSFFSLSLPLTTSKPALLDLFFFSLYPCPHDLDTPTRRVHKSN